MTKKYGGVYEICFVDKFKHTPTKNIYIGATSDFAIRKGWHMSKLRNNVHQHVKLQEFYDIYGEECFRFYPLYFSSDAKDYYKKEVQYWHHFFVRGYNLLNDLPDGYGSAKSERRRKSVSKYWEIKRRTDYTHFVPPL